MSLHEKIADAVLTILAVTVMRQNLNADGLYDKPAKFLAQTLDISRPSATRLIDRVTAERRGWLVSAATGRDGKPINVSGRRETKGIFPWRIEGSPENHAENIDGSGVNLSIYSHRQWQLSAGMSIGVYVGDVDPCSGVNHQLQNPPARAVERQLHLARERLQRLEPEQAVRVRKCKGRDWTSPVLHGEQDIANLKDYVADLEAWSRRKQ